MSILDMNIITLITTAIYFTISFHFLKKKNHTNMQNNRNQKKLELKLQRKTQKKVALETAKG